MNSNQLMPTQSSQDKKIKRLADALRQVIGEHNAPADCYSSGPFYGDARDDVFPSCEALRTIDDSDDSDDTTAESIADVRCFLVAAELAANRGEMDKAREALIEALLSIEQLIGEEQ